MAFWKYLLRLDCDEILGIHFTCSRDGRPSGETYIELGGAEDVERALLKHRETMGQRYIEVFHSKRAEMEYVLKRSGKPLEASEAGTVVRIRGLPYGCTKEQIVNFFKVWQLRVYSSVRVGMEIAPNGLEFVFDGNGRATGEAYVRFVDKDTAERALDRHMEKIGYRFLFWAVKFLSVELFCVTL
ncbi:unnamed protein product [Soboliphyme baturini]|uniref:RRM domain-containing protein n=1 Tax=Soboliphyme baturini TaxID=241478 RepID=A0A183IBE0_9BILA|nr:unnamed protein product [Soboliphyme baturini]